MYIIIYIFEHIFHVTRSLCLDLLHLLEHIITFTSISSRFMLLIACISIMVYVISLFHCRIRYLVWVMGALAGCLMVA